MKNLLTLIVLASSISLYAQRNPAKEILVFFKSDVEQVEESINGRMIKRTNIRSSRFATDLSQIGISEEILTQAIPSFKEADTLRIMANGKPIRQLNMSKLYRFEVLDGSSMQDVLDKLNQLPEVLYAEPNGTIVPYVEPSDTEYDNQWGLNNLVNPGVDIHAEAAWDIYTGNPNNIIAIIDGGVDKNHVDLNDKIDGGNNGYGWSGHGIHVAGIAAAESDNNQGVAGVDWQAKIHARRIDNVDGNADTYDAIVDAVDYSSNVKVLNHSWGTTNPDGSPAGYSTTLALAFAYAYKANRVSVVAMGNSQGSTTNLVGKD